jgi:uncharacterized membrane protein
MLGGLLSFISAITFAYANATARRGVLTATVFQAVAISLPIALPLFVIAMIFTDGFVACAEFSPLAIGNLAIAGIIHFGWARHCGYRATKAMGANLVAPIQQYSLVVTLILAVIWLGETITILRLLGIVLVVLGPSLTLRMDKTSGHEGGLAPNKPRYSPNLREGYFYALLSAIGFGVSPIFIAMALDKRDIATGIAGGFISYVAATVAMLLPLFFRSQRQKFKVIDREAMKWLVISGIAVGISQMARYMALAIAPVSVVAPIQRLSLLFRIYFGAMINPNHEVFGERVLWATILSLAGAIALSASVSDIPEANWLPTEVAAVLQWHWP